jgi:hypothetical protein
MEITTTLESTGPYSQGRPFDEPKGPNESHDEHDARCWRQRLHVTDSGHVFIPPMPFKVGIAEAAKFRGAKIPGKRNATWTKHFEAGILVIEPIVLGIEAAAVPCEKVYVPSDGKRGGGTRVWKRFPLITAWKGTVTWHVFDPEITKPAFEEHLEVFGSLIGIGRFRVRNNGYYGRFKCTKMKVS